ncbi:transposase family protein [Halomonas sp. PA5]|nr:transposase family protein [Halomonas sp. PA5]
MDFVSDQPASGRRFRVLNIVDDFSRECVGQWVDTSIPGRRLARFLDEIAQQRSLPASIVCDNGPELTSKAMFFWVRERKMALAFIQPGKPTQNEFIESFNGKFRDSCLNQHWFLSLADAGHEIGQWKPTTTMSDRTARWAICRPWRMPPRRRHWRPGQRWRRGGLPAAARYTGATALRIALAFGQPR